MTSPNRSLRTAVFIHSAFTLSVVVAALSHLFLHHWIKLFLLPLPTFFVMALVAFRHNDEPLRYRASLLIGYVLSLLGAYLLGLHGKFDFFLAGLFAYLANQICYLVAFLTDVRFGRRLWPFLPFAILAAVFFTMAWPQIPGHQKIAVATYTGMFVILCGQAISRTLETRRSSTAWAIAGATLLMVSDFILGINRFYTPIWEASLFVMITYFFGQWFVAASAGYFGQIEMSENCHKRMHWRVFWIAALLALGVCIAGFAIERWRYRHAFVDVKAIKRIDVWLQHQPEQPAEFTINDQATIIRIFDAMKPFSGDSHPLSWQIYGDLKVEFADGTKAEVAVFSTEEEVAAFSINRVYYRGGSEPKLKAILESEIPKEIKRVRQ